MIKGIKTLVRVIVYSSANREKISLTIKAGLVMIATFAVTYFGADQAFANGLANDIAEVVNKMLGLVSYIFATYGLVRKIALTASGESKTL